MTTNTLARTASEPATRIPADAAPAASPATDAPAAPALAPAAPPAPSVHRRLLLTWLAVYPTITVIQELLGTSVAHLALPVRTLIVTALVAPVVVYLALPQIMKADRRIARAWHGRNRNRNRDRGGAGT